MFFCGNLPLFLLKTGHSTKDPNSLPLVHLSSVFLLHEKTNPDGWSKLQNKREKETEGLSEGWLQTMTSNGI
jgi:hypothetical protein